MHKKACAYAFFGIFGDSWGAKRERLSSLFFAAFYGVPAVYFTLKKN
jgi:hypothetical protein